MLIRTQTLPRTHTIPKARRSWSAFIVGVMSVAYLLGLGGAATALWTLSDQWWPATVLLFSPRWVLALPMLLMIPLAAVFHRKSLIPLGLGGTVLAFPLLGYCFSTAGISKERSVDALRVMSCNVHRQQLDVARFRELITETNPDVIALQDWTSDHEDELFAGGDWHTRRDGELFIASRFPIASTSNLLTPPPEKPPFNVRYGAAVGYELLTPDGPITLVNLHLASPHEALQAMRAQDVTFVEQLQYNSQLREAEAGAVSDYLQSIQSPAIVVGDFNTPRESPIFREFFGSLTNAFSKTGTGFGMTHISRASWVRIDHLLASEQWNVRECWLGEATGSPHLPIIGDFALDRTAHLQKAQGEP